ncbi:MAG TPA: alpha/beta hydrolase [Gemmatimonadaceae bacterium]
MRTWRGVGLLTTLALAASCRSHKPETVVIPIGARERVIGGGSLELDAFEWPGDGTPLIMLHGLGGNAASWGPIISRLSGRHVIALDLPGHGASPTPASWDFHLLARDIVTAVDREWPGEHIWIGHSWGGKLAVAAAAADSAHTRGVVLVDAVQASPLSIADPVAAVNQRFVGELDPWPNLDSALAAVRNLPQFSPWTPDVEIAFRRAVVVQPNGRVVPLLTRQKGAAIIQTLATDLTRDVSSIPAPVLVLSAPSSVFETAHRALFPRAEFVTLTGNHWLQISNPEGTASAIVSWLQRNRL